MWGVPWDIRINKKEMGLGSQGDFLREGLLALPFVPWPVAEIYFPKYYMYGDTGFFMQLRWQRDGDMNGRAALR